MLESIGKGNICIAIVCMTKKTTNKATKHLQHQNRKKYETIVEEIKLLHRATGIVHIFPYESVTFDILW